MKKLLLVLFITIVCIIVIVAIFFIYKYYCIKKYSFEYFNIERYVSDVDKDEDGIDDQTDIFLNAKAYIGTKPIYKSKYYATGYPNDEYGVCTDVVAFALKGAGYDLMEMVDEDIRNNLSLYHLEKADKKIDFRRVKNLKIFFERHFISLTTDIYDISAWQAGDIVLFKGHVGIISDNRTKKGIAYVLHNTSVKRDYEENVLEQRKDEIEGHFRVS